MDHKFQEDIKKNLKMSPTTCQSYSASMPCLYQLEREKYCEENLKMLIVRRRTS